MNWPVSVGELSVYRLTVCKVAKAMYFIRLLHILW